LKTNWPSKLVYKFTNNNKLIPDLLVYFALLCKTKNKFAIGPLLTNSAGQIELAHDTMTKAIENLKAEFPMDYSGGLEACNGIEVTVDSIAQLNNRINRLQEFYPEEAEKLKTLKLKCENYKYTGYKTVNKLPIENKVIEVILQR
jgi:hypothetical protein